MVLPIYTMNIITGKGGAKNMTDDTFVNGIMLMLRNLTADYEEKQLFSERSEKDTLPGLDNMTEEQWRMFAETVE